MGQHRRQSFIEMVFSAVFPRHHARLTEADQRIAKAQLEVQQAQIRVQRAREAAARARKYREDNQFAAMIIDSLGIRHDH